MDDQNLPQASAKAGKPRRLVRILFGFSLGLNLLVIGAIAGVAIKGPPSRSGPPGLREISAPYVAAFERSEKREMRSEMRKRLPDRASSIAANQADYTAFLALVRAETFDAIAASQIIEGQLSRASRLQEVGRQMAVERLRVMSQQERLAYADRLQGWLDNKSKRRAHKSR